MENDNQNGKTIMGVLAALMLLFLAGGIYYWVNNGKLIRQNDLTERRADSLLSVKLQLEGDLGTLKNQLQTTAYEKQNIDKQLAEVSSQLAFRDRTLSQLRRNNIGNTRTIGQLNRDMVTLNTQRDSLENQMAAVNTKITHLTSENSQLATQNKEIDPLRQQVKDLNATLLTKVPRSSLTGDAFRVETIKSNEKETAKAKKVDKLMVSLSVPAEMQLKGSQEVYLSLTDEQHNVMMPPLSTNTITLPGANEAVPVHAVQTVNFDQNPQRISFSLDPVMNIKPGLYRASVYTKDAYLGATEFRLRDSFWFF